MMRDATASCEPLPAELLRKFLDSGRSEKVFAELMQRLGGLVYNRVLRGTGDSGLAEEITQNVFAILARKAEALQNHVSLSAWILKTTKLESAKAMRKVYHRRRVLSEYATQSEMPSQPEEVREEVLPLLDELLDRLSEKDQNLIVFRFYEGRKFHEIAQRSGRSEAACKMQLKRALGKLSGWLSSKGVALSVTGVTSVLAADFAKAAPVQVIAAISAKSLAASEGISTTTLLTNTIQTMSMTKQVSATIALVASLTMIPFS